MIGLDFLDGIVGAGGGGVAAVGIVAVGAAVISQSGSVTQTREKAIEIVEAMKSPEIRDQSVYVLKNTAGEVRYVGRTNDPIRRAIEHKNDLRHPWRAQYTMTVVASGLTLSQSRLVEQALISAYTLAYLENARREIARHNLVGFYGYADALTELLCGIPTGDLWAMLGE